jgi:large subunit ribosomal protein L47
MNLNAFWKYRNLPKKYYQFPKIDNGNNNVSVLSADYYKDGLDQKIVTGRAWRTDELRLKSTSELHKLYYVLLKEKLAIKSDLYYSYQKSFLNTIVRRDLAKIQVSMNRLQTIVTERDHLRNDFMSFLEYYYIRTQQNIEKGIVEKKVDNADKVHIKGQIEDQSKDKITQKVEKEKKKEEDNDEKSITVLTEKEIKAVHKLKKNYSSKNTLLKDYVKNPQDFKERQKRKLFNIVQRARAKTAKEIFTKELSAIAYKLKNSKI